MGRSRRLVVALALLSSVSNAAPPERAAKDVAEERTLESNQRYVEDLLNAAGLNGLSNDGQDVPEPLQPPQPLVSPDSLLDMGDVATGKLGLSYIRTALGHDGISAAFSKPPQPHALAGFGRDIKALHRRNAAIAELNATRTQTFRSQKSLEAHLRTEIGAGDPEQVAKSFVHGLSVDEVMFDEDVQLVRIFGGEAKLTGRYFVCCLRRHESGHFVLEAKGLALPPGNLQDHIALLKFTKGSKALIGVVADAFAKPGLGTQVFIQGVSSEVMDRFAVTDVPHPSDVRVIFDGNRQVRFSRSTSTPLEDAYQRTEVRRQSERPFSAAP
jgi:hypothetical protein